MWEGQCILGRLCSGLSALRRVRCDSLVVGTVDALRGRRGLQVTWRRLLLGHNGETEKISLEKKKKKHFVKGTVQHFGEKEFPKGWTIPLNLDYFGLWNNRLKQSVNDFNALKILQDVLLLEKLKALKTLFVFELLGSQILKNTLYMDFRAVTPFCWSHRLRFHWSSCVIVVMYDCSWLSLFESMKGEVEGRLWEVQVGNRERRGSSGC